MLLLREKTTAQVEKRRACLTATFDRRSLLAALGYAGLGLTQAAAVLGDADDIDGYITKRMAQEGIPGLSVAVLRDRRLVWSKGYGWANIGESVPMTPDTVLNIGSVSKLFTAVAVMRLVEQGRVALDDDVNIYLRFKIFHPVFHHRAITLRQLLSHQSAINDGPTYSLAYACGDPSVSLEEWVREYLTPTGIYYDAELNFHSWAPGDGFAYNNIAFAVIAYMVECVTGKAFAEYCWSEIFEPLGMTNTSWYLKDIDNARHAIAYSWVEEKEVRGPSWGGLSMGVIGDPRAAERITEGYAANCLYSHPNYPDGFLRSDVLQLSRFAQACLDDGLFEEQQILLPETLHQMIQPQSGDATRVMGLTWNAQRRPGRTLLWGHSGSDPGINSTFRLRFEDGVAAIVLMNTNLGSPRGQLVALELAEYLIDRSHHF
jgi:CubicO group peptidase (beta-lactamase class C family)